MGIKALYDRYQKGIYGIILRTVRDTGAAEEVMQQTFLRAWERIDQYDSNKSALFTWLSVIARSAAIDRVRLRRYETRQKTEPIIEAVHDSGQQPETTASLDAERLLERLDDKYRDLLRLKYLQGYSQSEIAQELELPLGTVKTRLRSAILQLRHLLRKEKKYFVSIFLTV